MAFEDYKITSADLNGKGVIGLPDAPQLSAENMQKKFEETARDVIIPRINTVLEKMDEVIPPMVLPEAPLEPQNGDMLVYDSEIGAFVFVQKATSIANLKDVDLTGLVNGMYLRYDFPTRSWKATNSSASVPALDDINDVSITNATNGQCLIYNGGTWKNDNEKLDDLKNVYIHLPQNKQLLAYDAANDRWTNVELDGGGHKILNASGTELTQRPKMKFKGLLKATDNGTDEITEVTDEAEEISFADWDALTDAQKEAYSAGKKLNILDPPDCDGEVEVELMKLAWSNPNPSATTFSSQDVNLNTDGNYDFTLWKTTYGNYIVAKGASARLNETATTGSNYTLTRFRACTYVSDTKYTVNDAQVQNANGTRSIDNSVIIPLEIYTFKKKPTAKINAIATNVKATVDYSTSEHKIGKWIDGSDLYEKTVDFGALPNATMKDVAHGINNLKNIVFFHGAATDSSGAAYPVPFAHTSTIANNIDLRITSGNIRIITGVNYSTFYAYITLRYTKTS